SRIAHNGYGNAIAQCYNHVIMPLASEYQKLIQVKWGIADFEFRFGRKPQGIWLPETAVDLATLQVLADCDIRFTILAPHQAQAVRLPGQDWQEVLHGGIDTTQAYRCRLNRGRHIDLFFYDQPVSHDISFEGLLKSGDRFAERLTSGFNHQSEHAQLLNIATDGETFGHHSKFGDMALAYAIKKLEQEGKSRITNYAEYLSLHEPTREVRIRENTSWSCAHGVERWQSDCGCNSGNTHYHQRWRGPLRRALTALHERLDAVFQRESSTRLLDPYGAVDDYIEVILDRSGEKTSEEFLRKRARGTLSEAETVNVWRLLEMQRHAMLMYTSCGWFFDDISNIETVKIIEYAARATQLARDAGGVDLEPQFIADLASASGNKPHLPTGAQVYEELVRPSVTDLKKGLAHYGISSLMEDYSSSQRIFAFEFERKEYAREKTASRTLAVGAVNVRSSITREYLEGMFVVLHLGGYDFHCAVRPLIPANEYESLREELFRRFGEDSTRNLLQAIDARFACDNFALKDLFIDERRKIGRLLLEDAVERSRRQYQRVYEESRDVMRLLVSLKIPAPDSLKTAAEYVLTSRLEDATAELSGEEISDVELREIAAAIFREAAMLGCKVDLSRLKNAIERIVYSRLESYRTTHNEARAESALRFINLAEQLDVKLDLWRLQNLFWELLNERCDRSEPTRRLMEELGERLRFSTRVVETRLC
ncbi:MAG: DUF3536 domain-containing protein, partial [Blastocatellia bacterium]